MRMYRLPLLMIFLLVPVGCIVDTNPSGSPIDYGAKSTQDEVLAALSNPVRGSDPTATKLGAWVKFETTQSIAGGQVFAVVADTTQTVTERQETADVVALTIVEGRRNYKQNDKPETVSRSFNLAFEKAKPKQLEFVSPLEALALAQQSAGPALSMLEQRVLSLMSQVQTSATPVTYHRLRTTKVKGPPPKLVREAPGCAGLPDCQMTYNTVSFDQVIWSSPSGDRIRFEFVVSPEVPQTAGFNMSLLFPYYPGLMRSCVTLMVSIGDENSNAKTLLTECQNVFDFRLESR